MHKIKVTTVPPVL